MCFEEFAMESYLNLSGLYSPKLALLLAILDTP